MGDAANMYILSALDDIAWLLNLRGNDISYNPLFFSYVIFHKAGDNQCKVDLFIDESKVSDDEIKEYLTSINVTIHAYTAIEEKIKEYGQALQTPEERRMVFDKGQANYLLFKVLKESGFEFVDGDRVI